MEQGSRPGDPEYLKVAFSKLGISEIEGARNEKQILAMYKAAGHPEVSDDETPWCAAFVGWCLEQAGLPNTKSLLAKSYAHYGKPTPFKGFRVPRGAICVWSRAGGGHVNFCLEDDGEYITGIGGNQENGKGGGVTISRRRKDSGLIAAVIPPFQKVIAKAPPDVPWQSPNIKPAIKSKTNWASIGTMLTPIIAALTDWRVALVIAVALGVFIILERTKKIDIVGWL